MKNGQFSFFQTYVHRASACVFCVLLLVLCVSCFSCGGGGGGGGGKPGLDSFFFSGNQPDTRVASLGSVSAPSSVSSGTYTFLLISDLHFGVESDSAYPKTEITASLAAETGAGRAPSFIVVCGDQTENGTAGEFARYKTFEDWLRSAAGNVPVFGIAGNHDLYNGKWDEWKSKAGPGSSFYTFKAGNRSFYFIDSASGTLGSKQLAALETALKNDPARKFLFSHYPLVVETMAYFIIADARERAMLLSLISTESVDMVFTGHRHEPLYKEFGTKAELITGSLKPDKHGNRHWTFVTVNESAKTITIRRYSNTGSVPSFVKEKSF